MNTIVLLTLSVLAVAVPGYAQFGLPFETDCTAGRLIDPFLVQALKSKYPKKYSAKLDFAKDLALDAKYKLQAAKMLARHMKNLNAANYDLQSLMYQAQQPGMLQPVLLPDQSALMAQQQQQQFANYQIPIDASRSLTLTPQTDSSSCYSQLTDPRYQQQATLQLTGMQGYGEPDEKYCSKLCTKPESPCNCEEGSDSRLLLDPLTSVLSTFLGVLKNILK